jgi:hypothetical protein
MMHILHRAPSGSSKARLITRVLQMVFCTPVAIGSFYVTSCCALAVQKELGMIVKATRAHHQHQNTQEWTTALYVSSAALILQMFDVRRTIAAG